MGKEMGPRQLRTPAPPRYATRGNIAAKEKGETLPLQRLMPDPRLNETERAVQPMFSKSSLFNALALVAMLAGYTQLARGASNVPALGDRTVELAYRSAADPAVDGPARLAGAWQVTAPDPRFGGISGLAMDGGRLLALSDSAVAMWLDPPGAATPRVWLHSLAQTAGDPTRKVGRDSEAIAADPRLRGWWVAYEQIHSLLLYSRDFGRVLARIPVESADFRPNRGIEAIYPAGKGVAWRSEASGASDAARLPDGRLAILERRVGLFGFESRITGLGRPIELRLGRFDNPEAITAAPLPSGGTRLWVMTDNDLERWRPTLLLAIDLPKAPAR